MSVIELIAQLQSHDIQLYLEEEKLKVNAPKGAKMQDWLKEIKAVKPEIIAFLKQANSAPSELGNIAPIDRHSTLPISFSQQRLWFIDQLQQDAAYNMAGAFYIHGDLNISAMECAFSLVVSRQEQLRVNFVAREGQPEVTIRPPSQWALEVKAVSDELISNELNDFKIKYFNLEHDCLIRTQLYQQSDARWVLAIAMHHIISDAISIAVFTRELAHYYNEIQNGNALPSPLFSHSIQYIDYVAWQREKMQGEYFQSHIDYWKEKLDDCSVLELPLDRPRQAQQDSFAARFEFQLSTRTTEKLKGFSQKNQVTLFTTLLAAYKVLLYRYTGADDLCVGVPHSHRQTSDLENLIGFFINSLPIRSNLSGSPSFVELLHSINATRLEAEQYQELPFEQLLEQLGLARDMSHPPVFQTMFSLEHRRKALALDLQGLDTTFVALETDKTKFDLTLTFFETDAHLNGEFEFNQCLFETSTIEGFAKHLGHILEEALADPEKPIDEIPLLDEQEKNRLIDAWSGEQVSLPERGLVEMFEHQVARFPNASAVEENGEHFSFSDLQWRANKLANYLLANGLKTDDVVVICCTRGYELVVAMLSVLKAGGTYLPLDPSIPDARLKYVVEDAQPRFILSQTLVFGEKTELKENLPNIVCLDGDWHRIAAYSKECAVLPYQPERAVYIIYTSGSTGLPKGVVVPEQGICNLVNWHAAEYFQGSDTIKMGQVAGVAFDAAAWEIWTSLCMGAPITIAPEETRISAKDMVAWIAEAGITHLFLPTPLAEAIFAEPLPQNWSLAYLFTGGDRLNQYPPDQRSFKLINAYGPTEAAVVATAGEICTDKAVGGLPSIGRPITNARIYILDKNHQPVPVGVMGELYIGGVGVAKGYLNNQALSDEKFINNPFSSGEIYCTGDLARWLPNGEIAYCGRLDQQVQIRGFRVELGEIENILNKQAEIKESVVRLASAVGNVAGSAESLVAYVVLHNAHKASFNAEGFIQILKHVLPDYMVPHSYCAIDQIPVTVNGKIDYKQLPFVSVAEPDTALAVPTSKTEETIYVIWKEILETEHFGVQSNFFQIGGHSLLATRMMARLREAFNKNLPLRFIFDYPVIADLAVVIDAETKFDKKPLPALLPVSRDRDIPLTFSQERLWVLDRLESGAGKYNSASAYNISSAFRLKGVLDIDALSFAFTQLVLRHEILRTTFSSAGEQVVQCIKSAYAWNFTLEDVSDECEQKQLDAIALLKEQETSRAFDLEKGHDARRTRLIRTRLLKCADDQHVLFITLHHIIADGWSVEIISHELSFYYRQALSSNKNNKPELPELPIQYADYAIWQKQVLQDALMPDSLSYWCEKLEGTEPLALTTDYPRPSKQTFSGAALYFEIPTGLFQKVERFSQQQGITTFVILMSAYKVLLSRYSGQNDICVGTPVAQRPVKETEGLVGFFINTLSLRSEINAQQSFLEQLQVEHRAVLEAFDHQDIPFEKIVDALQLPRDLSRSPIFQTLFSFQKSDLNNSLDLEGLETVQLPQSNTTSQFEVSLAITESNQGLTARYDYNTDLFSEESIRRFADGYTNLLACLVAKPDCLLSDITILDKADETQQLIAWNQTVVDYPKFDSLPVLFERQVAATPATRAVVFEEQMLSYAQLNAQANQFAHFLISQGAGKDRAIAVCMQRSVELVVTLYAILKSGAAYLPLDVSAPQERLQGVLDDAQVQLFITENGSTAFELAAEQSIVYSEIKPQLTTFDNTNPLVGTANDDLAYVIYTSGSTGKPKGVAVPHRGVINRLQWMQDAYPINDKDVVLQKTPYSFDVSVWEFFWPLFTGASVVLAKPDGHKDPDYLCQLIQQHKVSTLHFVPSMLGLFLQDAKVKTCSTIKTIFCSGEALKPEHVRQSFICLPHARLINLYGPTEASIDVSAWECQKEHRHSRVPIGKPIANTQLYILDENKKPLPVGVPGELYIGGVGLARGYLFQDALTSASFIDSPFAGQQGEKLYKTGDRARYLADGNIDYLGRLDFQVKLRGQRIELGEIENQLDALPEVGESVVVLVSHLEEQHLVAYVSCEEGTAPQAIKEKLRKKLPDYMLPSAVIILAALPLSENGKVDRKALPAWHAEPAAKTPFVAPRNEMERTVAQFWCGFLKLDAVGVHDNFFELGGHSLMATQIVSRIRERYEVEISLAKLFEKPTIEALAIAVLEAEMEGLDEVVLEQLLEEI
ncbi:MAG: amino acid adenylation domain-containing protein [Gammaproteobacteria bacterium]|nr:amino acid adenylation domain-containing protein [Gammaproteobacteria bacterium]